MSVRYVQATTMLPTAKFFILFLVSPTAELIGLENLMAINFKTVASLATISLQKKKSSKFDMHQTDTQPQPHSLMN